MRCLSSVPFGKGISHESTGFIALAAADEHSLETSRKKALAPSDAIPRKSEMKKKITISQKSALTLTPRSPNDIYPRAKYEIRNSLCSDHTRSGGLNPGLYAPQVNPLEYKNGKRKRICSLMLDRCKRAYFRWEDQWSIREIQPTNNAQYFQGRGQLFWSVFDECSILSQHFRILFGIEVL